MVFSVIYLVQMMITAIKVWKIWFQNFTSDAPSTVPISKALNFGFVGVVYNEKYNNPFSIWLMWVQHLNSGMDEV